MDQIHIHQPASRFETALARLFEQAGPLAAIAGVFVTLTIFGGLGLVGGLVGFVAVSAAVLLLPPGPMHRFQYRPSAPFSLLWFPAAPPRYLPMR
ncbi:hypothetical protein PSC71_08140 [Devosia sp. J2-20]|uniref:hypothetical protein n=1 Tax=Devosia sp. J2-20 TaxID=3026161 RepID=UPI00249A561C|nr:hypothetical protein [Devosia sp. J2-20]WDR00704.1 hypothetical protein PSC71_08140 [Devosia sp. J2-20]